METYSRIELRSHRTYGRIGLLMETCGRFGLLRSYGNLQSYWTTTRPWKLTVVLNKHFIKSLNHLFSIVHLDLLVFHCRFFAPIAPRSFRSTILPYFYPYTKAVGFCRGHRTRLKIIGVELSEFLKLFSKL